jgi:hypothetical protein
VLAAIAFNLTRAVGDLADRFHAKAVTAWHTLFLAASGPPSTT